MATPCTARKAIIGGTVCDIPAPMDPTTNSTMASWIKNFLLNRSESLPQIGVVMVIANRDEVITQVYCRWVPCRSDMIVGSAVETIVDEIRAVNRAAIRPVITSRICRWVSSPGGVTGGAATAVVVMRCLRSGLTLGLPAGCSKRRRRPTATTG